MNQVIFMLTSSGAKARFAGTQHKPKCLNPNQLQLSGLY